MQLAVSQALYLGHLISGDGIAPDPKIQAVTAYPQPSSKAELLQFLGMAIYTTKLVPHLAHATYELRQLLKQDSCWHWNANSPRKFKIIKELLAKAPVLSFFSASESSFLPACFHGLDAVLIRNERPAA